MVTFYSQTKGRPHNHIHRESLSVKQEFYQL